MSDHPVPESHPRYLSLMTRKLVTQGVVDGITSPTGLIAHGRGEAYDYLLGERTHDFAIAAIEAAMAQIHLASYPVLSVNGNVAALVPAELALFSQLTDIPLEVNIFHASPEREERIRSHLLSHGAPRVLLPTPDFTLPGLESNRRFINPEGIGRADLVFVPLEDGDRAQALSHSGKKVVTVDLNPLSRTAKTADITIVDNVVRVFPQLRSEFVKSKSQPRSKLQAIVDTYDNDAILKLAVLGVISRFQK